MRRILIEWRGTKIYSYMALLYVGLVLGTMAGNYAANLAGLDSLRVLLATLLLTIVGLIGTRLFFVALRWNVYRHDPRRIWRRGEGGGALLGGLLLGMLALVPLARWLDLPLGPFADVITLTMVVAAVPARLGCLLNGCCAGRATSSRFGLCLPDHHGVWQRRVPTQLLESAWTALLLIGAILLWGRSPYPGALALYLFAGYGLGRFVLDFTRAPHGRSAIDVGAQRALSALLFGSSAVLYLALWWVQRLIWPR